MGEESNNETGVLDGEETDCTVIRVGLLSSIEIETPRFCEFVPGCRLFLGRRRF